MYQKILAGVKRLGLPRADYVFFELHCIVDDHHQLDLYNVACELCVTDADRRQLRFGVEFALELRCEFWDHLYAIAVDARGRMAA